MHHPGHARPEWGHPDESRRRHIFAECAGSMTYRHYNKRHPTLAHVHAYMFIFKTANMLYRTRDERKAEIGPPRSSPCRAQIDRAYKRMHAQISSSVIEPLHMSMRHDLYAKQRACIGARQALARPKTDPQEGWNRPLESWFVCAGISSGTQVYKSAHVQNPSFMVYLSDPRALPRGGERVRAFRTPKLPRHPSAVLGKCTNKLPRVNARAR